MTEIAPSADAKRRAPALHSETDGATRLLPSGRDAKICRFDPCFYGK